MVLALMLIAIDPFSSVDLKLDIIVAINSISDSIKGDSNAVSATVRLHYMSDVSRSDHVCTGV